MLETSGVNYKRHLRTGSSELFSSINIIPFTDIVLVLLIIFMVSIPSLIQSSLGVKLPKAQSGVSSQATKITITVNNQGKVSISGKEIPINKLAQTLSQLKEKQALTQNAKKNSIHSPPPFHATLNADEHALHGQVIKVLDILRSVGVSNIYVGTNKK